MPMLRVNGTEIYYEDTGGGGPAILRAPQSATLGTASCARTAHRSGAPSTA